VFSLLYIIYTTGERAAGNEFVTILSCNGFCICSGTAVSTDLPSMTS